MSKRAGFTIMELIIVVAVIGVLVAVITVLLVGTKANARDARREKDVHGIKTALDLYQTTYNSYPRVNGGRVVIDGRDELSEQLISGDFLTATPRDPIQNDPYLYTYYTDEFGASYQITYCLETETPCERIATP